MLTQIFEHSLIIQKNKFFPLPEYELSKQSVTVTIEGKVIDVKYASKLASMPDLTLEEIMLLDKVQKGKQITSDDAIFLKRKKLIEGKRPNLYISSNVAQVTDQKDDYIKLRGIDDTYCQSIILEYLAKFKSAIRVDFEKILLDKLPDILDENQKKNKIKNNLQALRKLGKIVPDGRRWHLSKR